MADDSHVTSKHSTGKSSVAQKHVPCIWTNGHFKPPNPGPKVAPSQTMS